jgi:hypothetical protein
MQPTRIRQSWTRAALGVVLLAGSLACAPQRTIDGSDNNPYAPQLGAAHTLLVRLADADYADGVYEMAGAHRKSAREISNLVCDQRESIPNRRYASDFVWQWGQFVDHDIDLTQGAEPAEPADIPVPRGDRWFDPFHSGTAVIPFNRSLYDPATGSGRHDPREHINQISAWIDASNLYGSDSARAAALRANDGSGRLATSEGDLLPWNEAGFANAGGNGSNLFLAGDVRANEQAALTAMHTLWVREHNHWAGEIRGWAPDASGDEVYEAARILVTAEMQIITYREFLPALLGPGALRPYRGYDPSVDAGIASEFSTAAYRLGHSMLNATLLRLDRRGRETRHGHLALRDAFFAPHRITDEGGIEPLLRGLAAQRSQKVDPYVIDDVRNFLFGPPGSGGFDLAALNIQRGRDHGLPSYNDMREAMGLARARDFGDVSRDPEVRRRLAAAYDHVDDIDLWVGGLAERPLGGALVGPLVRAIVADQFEALRDGDRFYYRRSLPQHLVQYLERTKLSTIIRRNTRIGHELQDDVFRIRQQRGR